jgi:dCMP deaminase
MRIKNERISWEEYALKIAQVGALRSEDVYTKVGACALDHSNKVIGVAYNGLAKDIKVSEEFWVNRDKRRPFMIHAEVNLLSLFKRGDCKLLACTLLPCSSCASMIAAYEIKKVVYCETYTRDTNALEIFAFNNIECIQLNSAEETLTLLNEYKGNP